MSKTIEQKFKESFDKSAWKKYKFSDIAENIVEKVVPRNSELKHYVGLEHLDPGSLKIRRYGDPKSLKGDKQKTYRGDIILAKRNAYLKRVAVAEFDAIASAHSFVIRPKSETVLPNFLPYFMLSDTFWNKAIEISVGSLSPTINWKVLAKQEFLLPPKDQQAKITELLWAADCLAEEYYKVISSLEVLYKSMVENYFIKRNGWENKKLGDISYINKNSLKSDTDPNFEFEYLDISSIIKPKQLGKLQKYKFAEAPTRARRILTDGSIVLSLVRPYHKSFVVIENSSGLIASTGTGVIDVKENIDNWFIFHQFFTSKFMRFCNDRMSGTNYPAITPSDLKDFTVYLPKNLEEQTKVSNQLNLVDTHLQKLRDLITNTTTLRKSLLYQIFDVH